MARFSCSIIALPLAVLVGKDGQCSLLKDPASLQSLKTMPSVVGGWHVGVSLEALLPGFVSATPLPTGIDYPSNH